jgi:hypothetical protein
MAAKKKSAKPKAAKKAVAKKTTAKKPVKRTPTPKKPVAKAKPKAVSRSASPAPKDERAARIAAFSKLVIKEEEAPVAVRSFNEARQGIERSKELDVKSGQVKPAVPKGKPLMAAIRPKAPPPQATAASKDEDDIDAQIEADLAEIDEDMKGAETSSTRPKGGMQPLAGDAAVPRRTNPLDEEFRIGASAKKGKKGAPPTKEDLGKIELRMQRGTKDATIGTASPDYLQRSFNKAAEKGKVAATTSTRKEELAKDDEFEVAMDKGERRFDARLADFGDVEIAQQTRRGAKKVGKLDTDEEQGQ